MTTVQEAIIEGLFVLTINDLEQQTFVIIT
jgi:hypothetical protein